MSSLKEELYKVIGLEEELTLYTSDILLELVGVSGLHRALQSSVRTVLETLNKDAKTHEKMLREMIAELEKNEK